MDIALKNIIEDILLWTPIIGSGVVIFLVFFMLAKLAKRIIIKSTKKLETDKDLLLLLARTSSIGLITIGIITAFGTMGIDITALVAGLGLTGFALGFALKDTISNLLSGILILLYKPFRVGNRIIIAGYQGIVVAIDLRYTELDSQGNKILIPNSKLFTDPITVINE